MSAKQNTIGAAVGLGVGLCMALAANITYTWPQGAVMIGTGITAPLVLPLVLWIRSTFTPAHWAARLAREASVIAVAGPAVTLSYWHTYQLMLPHMPWWIALFIPLSADGVATISTLALHHHYPPRKRIKTVTRIAATQEPSELEKRVRTVADEVQSRRGTRDDRVAWLKAQNLTTFTDQVTAVQQRYGCSQSTAKRIRAKAVS
jgi:hypothetical protein